MHIAYNQSYIHVIIAPELSSPLETGEIREKLYQHITEILDRNRVRAFATGGTRDHVHIASTIPLRLSLNDFIDRIKTASSAFLVDSNLVNHFRWQEGYFGVSQGKADMKPLIRFINGQMEYHRNVSFKEEYIRLLEENGFEFNPDELFNFHSF